MSGPLIDSEYLSRAVEGGDWSALGDWLKDAEGRARVSNDKDFVQALLTTCDWLRQQAADERSRVATALRDVRTGGTAANTYDSVANL